LNSAYIHHNVTPNQPSRNTSPTLYPQHAQLPPSPGSPKQHPLLHRASDTSRWTTPPIITRYNGASQHTSLSLLARRPAACVGIQCAYPSRHYIADADFVLGCISKRPLPSSQDLRVPTFFKEHNKRIRLPPLPLLPPLAATTNQPLRNASRPRILLPLRNFLHLLPQSPPKHRRPDPQRSGIQHTRCSPSSARNHLSPNSRRLLLVCWQNCGEEDGGVS